MVGKRGVRQYDLAPINRFWLYVEKTDTCWLWRGYVGPKGYGRFQYGGKEGWQAHRWIYEQTRGPIPEGLVIDHLCRVRHCVNPNHLEPVTSRVNTQRGAQARAAESTHCPNGHERNEANVRYSPSGQRRCRQCVTDRARRYRHRIKADRASDPTWMDGYRAGYEAALRETRANKETTT